MRDFIKRNERVEYAFNLTAFLSDVRLKTGCEGVNALEIATGVSASMFSRWDHGKTIDMKPFMHLCGVCQLEPGNYFDRQVWELKK